MSRRRIVAAPFVTLFLSLLLIVVTGCSDLSGTAFNSAHTRTMTAPAPTPQPSSTSPTPSSSPTKSVAEEEFDQAIKSVIVTTREAPADAIYGLSVALNCVASEGVWQKIQPYAESLYETAANGKPMPPLDTAKCTEMKDRTRQIALWYDALQQRV